MEINTVMNKDLGGNIFNGDKINFIHVFSLKKNGFWLIFNYYTKIKI